jgi:hypothetical protein
MSCCGRSVRARVIRYSRYPPCRRAQTRNRQRGIWHGARQTSASAREFSNTISCWFSYRGRRGDDAGSDRGIG